MNASPLVSIGMPVYNCAGTIAQAIRSIQNQTFTSWELLIIDDGSRDGTAEVARSISDPRIHIISDGTNRQLPTRLNEAVSMAKGRYFARMDGDDISFPARLAVQLDYLHSHPEVDILGGGILVFRSDGSIRAVSTAVTDHESICGPYWSRFRLCHPTWIGETAWFRKHPYDTSASCTQDRVLLLTTYRESRFAAVPEVVLAYRQDAFPLSKSVPMRFQLARALWRDGRKHGELGTTSVSLAAEMCKLGLDVAEACCGVNHRHAKAARAEIDSKTRAQWHQLWRELSVA